jgi:hypothetical protein
MDTSMMMLLGSLLSGGLGALTGSKGEHGSTYNKNQLKGMDEILQQIRSGTGGPNQDITQNGNYQQGSEWLSNLFGNDPEFWNKFEAPLQRQFNEQTVPDLANRFASQGTGGSLGSTGFRNQLAREGSNLSTNIAALRGNMQQQGVNQALQYGQQPVNNWMQQLQSILNPTQNTYQPPSSGGWGQIAGAAASGAANSYFGQNQNAGGGDVSNPYGGYISRNPGQAQSTY